jgi:cellulose synthase/poly-beta-1,6-N-acetylglucosamine synthase-like glycosyltransferase
MSIVTLKIIFFISLFIVFYAYLGYGILLFIILKIKRLFSKKGNEYDPDFLPEVTYIVAAFNEEDWIGEKIKNSFEFDYPKDKIKFFFVTDGSDDRTPEVVKNYPTPDGFDLQFFHQPERRGKIAAIERVMEFVKTPIVVFSDANTFVNPIAIRNIVRHYKNEKVGAVAGEKRISLDDSGAANEVGEGLYWKYESTLKKWDSEFYSVVGAAGELFSVRTELYRPVPSDTIIEDFVMTMRIADSGYKVVYEPEARAVETASASVKEELKRKIRIAAGGIQAIGRLSPMLLPFKNPVLTFQYISHRVLRWTLAPLALPILLGVNIYLAQQGVPFFKFILWCQVAFYAMALIGYLLEKQKLKFKAFFVPYYFCMMNYAMYRGFFRAIRGGQSVLWERAKRG